MSESQAQIEESSGSSEASGGALKGRVSGNRNATLIAVAVALIAIVGFWLYRSSDFGDSPEASLALSRIMPYVEAGDMQKALNGDPTKKVRGEDVLGLAAIVDQYSSSHAGKTAALHAAIASLSLKKTDDAKRYFEIAEGSSSSYVAAGAQAGLASVKESEGDYVGAAELYEKAVVSSENSGAKDKYEYYAGMCYEKSGDKVKAQKMYENLLAEFEFSEFAGEAKAGLTRLGIVVE